LIISFGPLLQQTLHLAACQLNCLTGAVPPNAV